MKPSYEAPALLGTIDLVSVTRSGSNIVTENHTGLTSTGSVGFGL